MLLDPNDPRHKTVVSDQKRERYLIGHGHLEDGRIIRMVHQLKVVASSQLELHRESRRAFLAPIAAYNGPVFALSVIVYDLDQLDVSIWLVPGKFFIEQKEGWFAERNGYFLFTEAIIVDDYFKYSLS